MPKGRWLLYGANGYTGTLIAEEAKRRGLRPVLAGRRDDAVRPLAERLGLEHRVFPLEDARALREALDATGTVLLAAGPFSVTSRPVVDACLETGAHYLDITGEIAVFEACHARDTAARERGVVLMPGVGFDVVPSDCLAASLKESLPDATHLELAFAANGSPSKGTSLTMVEGLPHGGAIRLDGRIRRDPVASRVREVQFRDRARTVVAIPWGDVSTAYHSTKIPNIIVYTAMPRRVLRALRLARPLMPLMGAGLVQRALKRLAARATGPSEEQRRTVTAQLWGRVANALGEAVEGTLVVPEGYRLTALTAVESAERVASGNVRPGALTPSLAFGARYITKFEGCDLRVPAGRGAAATSGS